MKKFFWAATALICIVLASCGSDDNKGNTKKAPKKLNAAEIVYKADITGSIYDVCDIYVKYYDENGQEKTEKADENWSKTFTVKKFPAMLGMSISLERKKNAELTEQQYTINTNPPISYTGIAVDGSKTGTPTGVASERFMSTPLASKLDEWIERIGVSMAVIRNLHTADNNTSLIWEVL